MSRARKTRSRAARRRKPARPASRFDRSRLFPLFLFLVVLGLYAPSAGNEFVYDDNEVIVNQKAPTSFGEVAGIFGERHFPNLPYYRPVTRTTLLLQKTFHGDNPAPFHLLNATFMALAALVVYFLLRLPVFGVARTPALLGAALFALHPIASSCVYPTASGRETLLPSLWTLLSVYAYLRRGRGWRALSLVAFAGALFSKEQAVVIPALFVLADVAGITPDPPEWNPRRWIVRYLPLLPILAGYFWIRHLLFGGTEYAFGDLTGPLISLGYAFQTIFLPSVELVYEPTLPIWLSWPRLILSCLAVAGLLVLALRLESRHRPVLLFWTGWFLVTLAPTANIIQQEAKYDERYLFLASLALIAVAAAVASHGGWSGRFGRTRTAVGLLLVGAAGLISFHRSAYFHDNLAFSRQWLWTDPQSVNAHYNLGFGLAQLGRYQEAVEAYEGALEIEPDYGYAHNNLGNALTRVGKREEAIGHFSKSLGTGSLLCPGAPQSGQRPGRGEPARRSDGAFAGGRAAPARLRRGPNESGQPPHRKGERRGGGHPLPLGPEAEARLRRSPQQSGQCAGGVGAASGGDLALLGGSPNPSRLSRGPAQPGNSIDGVDENRRLRLPRPVRFRISRMYAGMVERGDDSCRRLIP